MKHVMRAWLSACLFVGIIALPVCAQDKLAGVLDELPVKEQEATTVVSGGQSFSLRGVLPIKSTVLFSAAPPKNADTRLTPGLRLAGVRSALFAAQPSELPEAIATARFGMAFSNQLNFATGGLKLSGEWSKVDAEFDPRATSDKNLRSLIGKMKQGYGISYEFGEGLTASRRYSRLTDQRPGSKRGTVAESFKTGLNFARDDTSFSFTIDETTSELARADRAGGRRLMETSFGHKFSWSGKDAALNFSTQELDKWGNTNGKKAEEIPALALEFTRGESKGKGKKQPDFTTRFSHTVTEKAFASTGDHGSGDVRTTKTEFAHKFGWDGKDAKFSFLQQQVDKWAVASKTPKRGIPTLALAFERGKTSIRHTVEEKATGSTAGHNANDLVKTLTEFKQGFTFGGRDAQVRFARQEDVKWGEDDEANTTTTKTVHLDLPVTAALKVAADHKTSARGDSPEVTQRTLTLTHSKFKGAQLQFQTADQSGENGFDTTRLSLKSHNLALPFNTTLKGDFLKIDTDGAKPHQQAKLHFNATSKPTARLEIKADYLNIDDSNKGEAVATKIDASYAVNDRVSLKLNRMKKEHDGQLKSGVTALTLHRKPSEKGGLDVVGGYTKREAHDKDIDPETFVQLACGAEEGIQARALYKHRNAAPDEYQTQVAFNLGRIRTTAFYTLNGFDAKRKKQDAGDTFDLNFDWQIRKGLELSTGLRASSAERVFAGGIGPRLQLKGKLSKNEELMVGYLPSQSALKEKKGEPTTYLPFAPGVHDIAKNIKGTADQSYVLRYTKIVDQDNLIVAYFRTGSTRMDSGMDSDSGDPFADKSAWLEYRSTF